MTGSSFFSVEKIADGRSGGTTQAETRIYNERLIVSLIRRHGQLSKADLTRLTGLAAQTITTIVNRAADSQLLLRPRTVARPARAALGALFAQSRRRLLLRPQGRPPQRRRRARQFRRRGRSRSNARRSTTRRPTRSWLSPRPRSRACAASTNRSPPERIAGLGIASPFHQWNLDEESGVPAGRLDAWQANRHPRRTRPGVRLAGVPLQRRDGGGRRRTDVRGGRRPRRLPLCLCRATSSAAAWCSIITCFPAATNWRERWATSRCPRRGARATACAVAARRFAAFARGQARDRGQGCGASGPRPTIGATSARRSPTGSTRSSDGLAYATAAPLPCSTSTMS